MPKELMNEFMRGLARGYLNSVAGKGLAAGLPGGGVPGGMADRLKQFGIGGTLGGMQRQNTISDLGLSTARELLR